MFLFLFCFKNLLTFSPNMWGKYENNLRKEEHNTHFHFQFILTTIGHQDQEKKTKFSLKTLSMLAHPLHSFGSQRTHTTQAYGVLYIVCTCLYVFFFGTFCTFFFSYIFSMLLFCCSSKLFLRSKTIDFCCLLANV